PAALEAGRRAAGVGTQVRLRVRGRRSRHRGRDTAGPLGGLARSGRARSLGRAAAIPDAAADRWRHSRELRRLSRRRRGSRPLHAAGGARNRPQRALRPGVDRAMTDILPPKPFSRRMYTDGDHLVGARWWQESLHRSAPDRLSRRKALLVLALALGPVAGGGLLAWLLSESDEVDITM